MKDIKTYERDGIIFFEEPYRVLFIKWVNDLDIGDSIAYDKGEYDDDGLDIIYIVCYAKTRDYNVSLRDVLKNYQDLSAYIVPRSDNDGIGGLVID